MIRCFSFSLQTDEHCCGPRPRIRRSSCGEALSVTELTAFPQNGPPPHIHLREDESFWVQQKREILQGDYLGTFKLVALDLGCWWVGKRSIRLSSKFVSEVLLCLSEIELVDHVKFASSALFELAD